MTVAQWEKIAVEDGFVRKGESGSVISSRKLLLYNRKPVEKTEVRGLNIVEQCMVEKVIAMAKPFAWVEYGKFFNGVIKKVYKVKKSDLYNKFPPVLVWDGEKVHVMDFAFDPDRYEGTPWDHLESESVTRPALHGDVPPGPFVVNLYYVKQFPPVDGVIGYIGGTLSWVTVLEKKIWKVICMAMNSNNEEVSKLIEKTKGGTLWT